jgi:hypothetical protein
MPNGSNRGHQNKAARFSGRLAHLGCGLGLETGHPQPVKLVTALREVRDNGLATPLPDEARRGDGGDSQQADTEDSDRSSRVEVRD